MARGWRPAAPRVGVNRLGNGLGALYDPTMMGR
jgi:hypothetical protein